MGGQSPFQAKRAPTFWRSFLHAWDGLIYTVVHQRNMRMHLVAALLVGQVGAGLPLGLAEKVTLIFCVLLVLFAEMLNSALEQLVDLAIQQFDEKAKLTKDIAAAGVLVLAIGTVVIFAAVMVHNAHVIFSNVPAIQRQVLFGVPVVVAGGVLMHERRRPWGVDVVLFFGALGLQLTTLRFTESYVFGAMELGLIVVCANAAWVRQQQWRRAK